MMVELRSEVQLELVWVARLVEESKGLNSYVRQLVVHTPRAHAKARVYIHCWHLPISRSLLHQYLHQNNRASLQTDARSSGRKLRSNLLILITNHIARTEYFNPSSCLRHFSCRTSTCPLRDLVRFFYAPP